MSELEARVGYQEQPEVAFVRKVMSEPEPAPTADAGLVGWLRRNLFSSVTDIILTLVAIWVVWLIVPGLIDFAFIQGVWSGSDRTVCATEVQGGVRAPDWFGACWAYVGSYLKVWTFGSYPSGEVWRVVLTFALFVIGLVPMLIPSVPYKRANALFLFLIFPILAFVLLTGGDIRLDGFLLPESILRPGLVKFLVDYAILSAVALGLVAWIVGASGQDARPSLALTGTILAGLLAILLVCEVDFGLTPVSTDRWGGLLVTLVIAVTGIAASLPLGILLALGRRSQMPVVRMASIIFIEFWRGVPLITVLFMSSVVLPLFLPEGVTFDKLLRALIGVALFSAAYMAEVVRGGIQALPKGQYEGAQALGLSYWQMMRLIILPQALKLVIPGIVNSFIALFKDTTLVLIIGLFDFLGMIQASFANPTWASNVQNLTAYLFAAVVYWFFCFAMSRYSIFMERRLDTGHR